MLRPMEPVAPRSFPPAQAGATLIVLTVIVIAAGTLAGWAAGVVAFGRMLRAAGLVAILIVIAVSDSGLGFPAAIVYALAFTVELALSLVVYFGGEAKA